MNILCNENTRLNEFINSKMSEVSTLKDLENKNKSILKINLLTDKH